MAWSGAVMGCCDGTVHHGMPQEGRATTGSMADESLQPHPPPHPHPALQRKILIPKCATRNEVAHVESCLKRLQGEQQQILRHMLRRDAHLRRDRGRAYVEQNVGALRQRLRGLEQPHREFAVCVTPTPVEVVRGGTVFPPSPPVHRKYFTAKLTPEMQRESLRRVTAPKPSSPCKVIGDGSTPPTPLRLSAKELGNHLQRLYYNSVDRSPLTPPDRLRPHYRLHRGVRQHSTPRPPPPLVNREIRAGHLAKVDPPLAVPPGIALLPVTPAVRLLLASLSSLEKVDTALDSARGAHRDRVRVGGEGKGVHRDDDKEGSGKGVGGEHGVEVKLDDKREGEEKEKQGEKRGEEKEKQSERREE
eukprot:Sspe_Gene.62421::Locus_35035_Transcript_1_1_Confidence_1.000_Length_1401::g.62421::m.62421